MGLNRFNKILSKLAFVSIEVEQEKITERQKLIDEENEEMSVDDTDDLDEVYLSDERIPIVPSLWSIQLLFDEFNKARQNFHPGASLCIDESTIEWGGKDNRHTDGCPVIKKNRNKPVTIHIEVKGLCCGTTGVMLKALPSGNKYDRIRDDFSRKGYPAHISCTLRLAAAFASSGRTVYADSWFGSVECATALWQEHGLFSAMVVKRNSKRFPKEFLNKLFESIELAKTPGDSIRGQSKFLTSAYTLDKTKEPVPLFATGWQDHRLLKFISTCGSSLDGDARQLKLWRNTATKSEAFTRTVKRPRIVQDYSKSAGKQDEHNAYRQGKLRLEKVLTTQRWEVRTFVSLFGMSLTDAYLSCQHFGSSSNGASGFEKFLEHITKWLIESESGDDSGDDSGNDSDSDSGCHEGFFVCSQAPIRDISRPDFIRLGQKRCSIRTCPKRTRFFCERCTPEPQFLQRVDQVEAFCAQHWPRHVRQSVSFQLQP